MARTLIFDSVVHSFEGLPFSLSELRKKLHECHDWDGTDSYARSCLRDRIRRNKIIELSENTYQWIERKDSKPQKNDKKSKPILNEIEVSLEEIFKDPNNEELNNNILTFLTSVRPRITDEILRESEEKEILRLAIKNAISAAVGGAAYKTLVPKKLEAESKTQLANLETFLIERVYNFESEVNHNFMLWHETVCSEIKKMFKELKMEKPYKYIDDKHCWTYGNSQKVVNLMVKYMYIISKRLQDNEINPGLFKIVKPFLEYKDDFHMPIDRIILDALWNYNQYKGEKLIKFPFLLERHKDKLKYSDNYIKPWSQWDKPTYDQVQDSCHKAISIPIIDFEIIYWPKFREIRRNHGVINYQVIKIE